jgi:hypothetical protein
MADLPQGIRVKAPHDKAPDFVKGQISIRVSEFQDWLSQQQGEWVNLDIKVSQKGGWYCSLNDWKPTQVKSDFDKTKAPEKKEFVDDSIPF